MKKLVLVGLVLALSGGSVGASVAQDNVKAQIALGLAYLEGQGVPQDYGSAANWFRKAADQGAPLAQSMLGSLYYNGDGVPQDYAAAASWNRKAGDQGDALAQANLGLLYARGQGVPQDDVQAHKWSNLAAARTAEPKIRGNAITTRDVVAARMTPAQIAEAQRLASEWKPN